MATSNFSAEQNENVGEDELTLKEVVQKTGEVFRYLKKRWLILFLVSFILATTVGMYAYVQRPMYLATLSFVLEEEKGPAGGGLSSLASQFGFDMGSSSSGVFSQANLMELMKSRELIETTLLAHINFKGDTSTLADIYIDSGAVKNKNFDTRPKGFTFLKYSDRETMPFEQRQLLLSIYKSVLGNLDVYLKDKKTSIVLIDFKDYNEFFSKIFAERLAVTVSEFYIRTKVLRAKTNVEILQRQADSLRASLNSAISGVAVANEQTFNANPALSIVRTPSIKRQVDIETNSAMLPQVLGSLEMAKISLRKETPLFFVIDKPVLPLLRKKPSTIKYFAITAILTFCVTAAFLAGKFFWTRSDS